MALLPIAERTQWNPDHRGEFFLGEIKACANGARMFGRQLRDAGGLERAGADCLRLLDAANEILKSGFVHVVSDSVSFRASRWN